MSVKRPDKNTDLGSFDINKWLALSAHVLARKGSRDRLCYEVLHRALRELAWRRRVDAHLETELKDVAVSVSRTDSATLRNRIKDIIKAAEKRARVPDIVQTKMVWKPHLAVELKRAKVLEKLNSTLLKPVGLLLVLHYNRKDLDKEHPIAATIERWE